MAASGFISHRIQVGDRRLFVVQDLEQKLWSVILQLKGEDGKVLVETVDKAEAEGVFISALSDISNKGDSLKREENNNEV